MIRCALPAITLPALTVSSWLVLEEAVVDPFVKTSSRNVREIWNVSKNLQG